MFLKNPLKLWKWTFENDVFQISANFWVTKWKPLSGKARQSVKSCLNQNLVIWSISENHFKAILRSKRNVLYLMVFLSFFANFWVTKLKLLSGKPRQSVEFKSKFGHRKLFRKWFWSHLEVKNDFPPRLKMVFFTFLDFFEQRSWKRFLGKWRKTFKTIWIKIWS